MTDHHGRRVENHRRIGGSREAVLPYVNDDLGGVLDDHVWSKDRTLRHVELNCRLCGNL